MRFSAARRLDDTDLLVHVHIPRAGGTSLRLLLAQALGRDRVVRGDPGDIGGPTAPGPGKVRCISGPAGYGAPRRFPGNPAYVTVVRHPVDRYVSLYAAILADEKDPHRAAAQRYGIDDFLRHALEGDDPQLRRQFGNLQCRLVCGEPNHARARAIIDDQYYLAAPLTEIEDLARMLLSSLGQPALALPRAGESDPRASLPKERLRLSGRSVDALMACESEDAFLHSHVQKAFACVRQAFEPARRRAPVVAAAAAAPPIPPQELRFMGESDEVFITHADYLSDRVLGFARHFSGDEPERLLDIGCGYGRLAYGLRRREFRGGYAGFDILSRHIAWLVENFPAGADDARYRFDHADIYNERYNPTGRKGAELPLPYGKEAFDCLVSLSVFTHLYEEEAARYVRQLAQLLRDGGLWVTTFFCLPSGAAWNEAPKDAVYPLASQVSGHAYVHSVEEPLLVIAFDEGFLLRLFAREGLEVVSQRKGRWFTKDDAIELQDWFVLRKRVGWAPPARRPARAEPGRCNICGSRNFGPGPNGRMARNGALPRCLGCDSLERHRAIRTVFQALPAEFLADRKALQFSPDSGLDARWFRSFELSIFEGENSLDIQAIDRPDGSYDFLSLTHVLESVPDDLKGFDELCRILSPRGLMHVSFGAFGLREETAELREPVNVWKTFRYYGRDLPQRFGCAGKRLQVLEIHTVDPCTGSPEAVHLFTRDEGDASRLRDWLSQDGAITVA
ncbi:MAG: class I SAM-dependent methyltransferase [Burkholderiaceae bacterium]